MLLLLAIWENRTRADGLILSAMIQFGTGRSVLQRRMSAIGTKRTSELTRPMSAFGGKADIALTSDNVRF
jgi:hypothetical protein